MCYECTDFKNVSDDKFTDNQIYRSVRNLIICFHGISDNDGFALLRSGLNDYDLIDEYDIYFLAKFKTQFKIENVDVQSCFALRNLDNDEYTVATGIAMSDKIHRVYASDGSMSYIPIANVNKAEDGFYIYLLEKDASGVVQKYPMGEVMFLLTWENQ